MPSFEWKEQTIVTYGEIQEAVMEIVKFHREYGCGEYEATEFVDDYGTYNEKMNPGIDGRRSAKESIGYLAGYQDHETKHLIFELFECEHPFFGRSDPTPDEAFKKGTEWGQAMKDGKPFP